MQTFNDLDFQPHAIGNGVQACMEFDNGYGVSVVQLDGSYGYPDLWELAVLKDGQLNYTTPITDDVLGWLTPEQVTEHMINIQKLKHA